MGFFLFSVDACLVVFVPLAASFDLQSGDCESKKRGAGTQTGVMGDEEEEEKERKDFLSRGQRPATTHAQL